MMYTQHIRDAAKRAADWLEANRDKHLAGELAITAEGIRVKPSNPKADCFCALGRFGKELGVEFQEAADYRPFKDTLGTGGYERVYGRNDSDKTGSYISFGLNRRSFALAGCAGVRALRDIAEGKEP